MKTASGTHMKRNWAQICACWHRTMFRLFLCYWTKPKWLYTSTHRYCLQEYPENPLLKFNETSIPIGSAMKSRFHLHYLPEKWSRILIRRNNQYPPIRAHLQSLNFFLSAIEQYCSKEQPTQKKTVKANCNISGKFQAIDYSNSHAHINSD